MKLKLICLTLIALSFPFVVLSQPSGGGPGEPPDVPITGIEILIAAGGALGIRKLIQSRKQKQ